MRKLFLFLFPLSVFAQGLPETEVYGSLTVTWIDENTVQVSGYGNGGGDYTNSLGSCTNCLAISPAEMAALKAQLISSINGCKSLTETINNAAYDAVLEVIRRKDEILTFQRFTDIPSTSSSTTSQFQEFTNYVYSVENSQTLLDRSHKPSAGASQTYARNPWIGYNNGIYDYATSVVYPSLSSIGANLDTVLFTNDQLSAQLDSLRFQVNDITEESCSGSCASDGGGTNSTSCSSCPCLEQWVALLDYVRHIDDDQHNRYIQLNQISNNVFNLDNQFDSYAKLVSGVLYNDATIVVDDGANSWSNVYTTGHSDLYDYNKSNILQRIELLLFGISYNTSTNWGDVTSDVESSVTDVQNHFEDVKSYVEDANDEYIDQVNDLSGKFRALWQAMNFFGAGNLSNFSLAEPSNTFGLYDMDYDFEKSADLSDLQRISRTCFQIFYWSIGIVFMLGFWWKVVTFTVNMSLRVVRFFNTLIT